MKLVKLDAIDSTNDYLKDLARKEKVENYTVITAEHQTKGKGQRGATWNSEPGKNLIMSILVDNFLAKSTSLFDLNMAVAMAVLQSLEVFNIPKLSVKWPNDIMSDDKKIGGILIENSFTSDNGVYSIVGIGINVNQIDFENLPQASSIALVTGLAIDRDQLLFQIIQDITEVISAWPLNAAQYIESYTQSLFKKDVIMPFQTADNTLFSGIIRGITATGRLKIEAENGVFHDFDIKEIKMIF